MFQFSPNQVLPPNPLRTKLTKHFVLCLITHNSSLFVDSVYSQFFIHMKIKIVEKDLQLGSFPGSPTTTPHTHTHTHTYMHTYSYPHTTTDPHNSRRTYITPDSSMYVLCRWVDSYPHGMFNNDRTEKRHRNCLSRPQQYFFRR